MNKTVIVNGHEFLVENENSVSYELVTFAPDGEGTRIIISKKDCSIDPQGNIKANRFEIDSHYR